MSNLSRATTKDRRVDLSYRDVDPLFLSDFVDEILELLPGRYSPITREKKGAQGYLYALPEQAGRFLSERLGVP